MDPLLPMIQPPRCPLQTGLLTDVMMHPHYPAGGGACLPPIPHSLMTLCDQLIPANQVAPALTHGWIPHVQPRWLHARPLHQAPLLLHAPPATAQGAAALGAVPGFIGGNHEEAVVPKALHDPHTNNISTTI